MNFLELVAALCRHYRWGPDFWRGMPWRTFKAWLRQANRERRREREAREGSPERWGSGDGWFADQHRKAKAGVS